MAKAGGRLSPRGRAIEQLLLDSSAAEVDHVLREQDLSELSADELELLEGLVEFIKQGEETTRRLQAFFDAVQRHIEDPSSITRATDAELLDMCGAASAQAEHAVDIEEIRRLAAAMDPARGVDPEAFAQAPLPGIYWAKDLYRELTRRGTPELLAGRRSVEEMLRNSGVEPPAA